MVEIMDENILTGMRNAAMRRIKDIKDIIGVLEEERNALVEISGVVERKMEDIQLKAGRSLSPVTCSITSASVKPASLAIKPVSETFTTKVLG